jgi:hypothetical protein
MLSNEIIKKLEILSASGDANAELAANARSLILSIVDQNTSLEVANYHATRMVEGLNMVIGMTQWPVEADTAETLVNVITNKHRVSDHFCLTPDDVANIINHVRVVVK